LYINPSHEGIYSGQNDINKSVNKQK